jgi:hypothetical protein
MAVSQLMGQVRRVISSRSLLREERIIMAKRKKRREEKRKEKIKDQILLSNSECQDLVAKMKNMQSIMMSLEITQKMVKVITPRVRALEIETDNKYQPQILENGINLLARLE